MATIEMAGEAHPLFHDFLGMSPPGGREAKSYGAQTEINGEASVKSSSALNGCTEGSVCSAPARFSSPLCSADPGCSSRESGAQLHLDLFWIQELRDFEYYWPPAPTPILDSGSEGF